MLGGRPRLRGVMGELSFEGDELELELERLDILSRRCLWFRRVGGVVAVGETRLWGAVTTVCRRIFAGSSAWSIAVFLPQPGTFWYHQWRKMTAAVEAATKSICLASEGT